MEQRSIRDRKGETRRTESTSLMKIRKKNENRFGTKGAADPVAPRRRRSLCGEILQQIL